MIDLEQPITAAFNSGMEVHFSRSHYGSEIRVTVVRDFRKESATVSRLYMVPELIYDLTDQLNERMKKVK